MTLQTPARLAAATIAIAAWLGLVLQCISTGHVTHSVLLTLWIVSAYFTILTNLLVAVVFTAVAANRTRLRTPSIVAGTMLSILLVGIIYALLLHGTAELSGGSAIANILLHMATPALVPLFWIALTPKGELRWSHPLLWAIYPLGYLAYALMRGAITSRYPYPFLDVQQLGWPHTAFNSLAIAAAFLLCSFALVWIDHRLARHLQAPAAR